jgi:hypothetical protein
VFESSVIEGAGDKPSVHQNEDNENSFLLIPASSCNENEEETFHTVSNKTRTNRRHDVGRQIYEADGPAESSVAYEAADLLTEKHRGDIKL